MNLTFSVVFLFLCVTIFASLHVPIGSLKGTENVPYELTDKQLAIQRWLSFLTFLQAKNSSDFGWKYWEANVDNPQLGLESTRYPLAFIAYTAGIFAYKTPAYRELSIRIIDNVIQRLIIKPTWQFIEKYWKNRPTFPDPVAYENIMYSGHLAQSIALYESLSGDYKYSTTGWDFVWNETTVMHYTTDKLNRVIYQQMVDESNGGGVSCEPNWVYIICQNHPHAAFALSDAIHGTNYSSMDTKWQEYMQKYGMEDIILYKNDRYLKILYQRQIGAWLPVATAGNDGWALSWMTSWSKDRDFICKGWKVMQNTSKWRSAPTGGKYIANDIVGSMLELNLWLATSFYPVLERQCNTNYTMSDKYYDAIAYFENAYATFEDTDADGHSDAYYYNGDPQYRIWLTSNLVAAMLIQENSISSMYHENFAKIHAKEPFVTNVDYPTILVRQAYYNTTSQVLHFTIQTEISKNVDRTSFTVNNVHSSFSINRNDQRWTDYELQGDKLVVYTNVGGDDHVEFRVLFV